MEKKFCEVNAGLLDEVIPSALDKALRVSRVAESTIYMIIAECLEEFSDIELELEPDNLVCNFFEKWNNDGHINGALSYGKKENGNNVLSCKFDLYEIRDTFETLSSDLFGSIPNDYCKKIDDSDLLSFYYGEKEAIEEGFQKINLPSKHISVEEDN